MSNKQPSGEVWMILIDPQKMAMLMAAYGLTHRELAKKVWPESKSHSYITRLINGKARTVNPDNAVKIAIALKCGVDDLFLGRADSIPGTTVTNRSQVAA